MDEDQPVGAFILSLIGGILILIAGVYIAILGGALAATGNSFLGGLAQGLGGFGVFLGLLLVMLSFALFFQPEHHVGYGVAIIVLSMMSLLTGAGFFLGLILGLVGGILGIIFEPTDDYEPLPEALARSPSERRCPNCYALVTGPLSYCPQCGSPLR